MNVERLTFWRNELKERRVLLKGVKLCYAHVGLAQRKPEFVEQCTTVSPSPLQGRPADRHSFCSS